MGETRQHFSCWSPCLGFFVCPCYNRTHPTLEKPCAENITVCENQGKQQGMTQKRQKDWLK